MSSETNDPTTNTEPVVPEKSEPAPITPSTPPKKPEHVAKAPRTKKQKRQLIITFAAVFGAIFFLSVGTVGGVFISEMLSPNDTPSLSTASDGNTATTSEETSIAAVAEKVAPSVVSIVTETQTTSYFGTTSGEAAGTGIFISSDGYVMTNNHVIEDATSVSVVDNDGNLYENVKVIGRDPLNDIAFLKVDSDTTFTAAELGNSSTVRIGQQVVAIGNALGQYSNTVTSGIISGTGRPVTASSSTGSSSETLTDLIQTDASINSGNSGGPLVNLSGQVIGINTAIVADANGIGFSIPINSTKGVLAGVLENGEVSRAFLGVSYVTITPDVARQYNLDVKAGAYVHADSGSAVSSGSPAASVGLKSGDIITKVNDEVVGEDGALSSILGEYQPGDKVTLTYIRNGETKTVTLNLGTYSS